MDIVREYFIDKTRCNLPTQIFHRYCEFFINKNTHRHIKIIINNETLNTIEQILVIMTKRVGTYKMMRREQLTIWKYLYNKSLYENIIIIKTNIIF